MASREQPKGQAAQYDPDRYARVIRPAKPPATPPRPSREMTRAEIVELAERALYGDDED